MQTLLLPPAAIRTVSTPRWQRPCGWCGAKTTAVRCPARSLMARLLLATVRQQAGQKLEAAEEFTRALDIDPANVAALVNSGTTLRELGKETEALARFESAVRVSPSTPGTNSSRMYSDLG